MKKIDLNELAKRAYGNAKSKGFHEERHSDGHYLMLVVCELAEAVEADRKGRRADRKSYDFLLGYRGETMRAYVFEKYIKDSLEDELADTVIRLLDYVGMKGYKLKNMSDEELNVTEILFECCEDCADMVLTFAERVYHYCIKSLINIGESDPWKMLLRVFALAKMYNIDLIWYIEKKMEYNETREHMHGKKY